MGSFSVLYGSYDVRYSFQSPRESVRDRRMERVLFYLNGTRIAVADLLLGAAGLALVLLAIMAWSLAARAARTAGTRLRPPSASARCFTRWKRSRGKTPGSPDRAQRRRGFGFASGRSRAARCRSARCRRDAGRRRSRSLRQNRRRTSGQTERKTRGDRCGAGKGRRADPRSRRPQGYSCQQASARRLRPSRLEAIIKDGLPPAAFEFQYTLSNNTRPDCVIRLPGDPRLMIIDAKFPLEAFTALREAASEEARKHAAARIRTDVIKHVRDIADRYFLPGKPRYSDSVCALRIALRRSHEYSRISFKRRIRAASSSFAIPAHDGGTGHAGDCPRRGCGKKRMSSKRKCAACRGGGAPANARGKLDAHFKIAQEDVDQIITSPARSRRRGTRIDRMDFSTPLPEISAGSFDKARNDFRRFMNW